MLWPEVAAIGKNAYPMGEPVLQTQTTLADPLPDAIGCSAAAAEYIRGKSGVADRQAEDQISQHGVHEIAAIIRHDRVCSDTDFPREEVVNPHIPAPGPPTTLNAGLKQVLESAFRGKIGAREVHGQFVG